MDEQQDKHQEAEETVACWSESLEAIGDELWQDEGYQDAASNLDSLFGNDGSGCPHCSFHKGLKRFFRAVGPYSIEEILAAVAVEETQLFTEQCRQMAALFNALAEGADEVNTLRARGEWLIDED